MTESAVMPRQSRVASPFTPIVLALVALAVTPLAAQKPKAPVTASQPSAGNGTIYVGSYSGHITAVDEATGTFTKIPLKNGAPYVVRLSPDRSRFYVQSANQERFEVVDAQKRVSLDTFTLSDARKHVRPVAYEVDPQHRTMVMVARTATKLVDRWEIGPMEFVLYDLAEHKVVRTVPWTIDPEPSYYSLAMRFSPDGKLLYVFGEKVSIFDVATMTIVDTWDLSLPVEPALGRFDPGPWDDSADPVGHVTGLFTINDTLMQRKSLAVAQIDLAKRTVDVFSVGPVPKADSLAFTMAPDHKHASILVAQIGRHQLWMVDLEARKITRQIDVPTRTRMQMRMSSGGLMYLYEAGRTIEVYSADASTRLRTIELDSDMMYATFVIVPGTPSGSK
jgi:hypothetical protein